MKLESHILSTVLIRVLSALYGIAFPFAIVYVYGQSASGAYIYLYGVATFVAFICIWGRNISIYAFPDFQGIKHGNSPLYIYIVATAISIICAAFCLLFLMHIIHTIYTPLSFFEGSYITLGLIGIFVSFQFMLVEIFRIVDKFWFSLISSNGFVGLSALMLTIIFSEYKLNFFDNFLFLSAVVLFCACVVIKRCVRQSHWTKWQHIARCLPFDKNSFHIGLVSVSSLVFYQVDIIIVGFYFGTEDLAPFAIGSRLGMAVNFFNTLVFSYAPKVLAGCIANDPPIDIKYVFRPQLRLITSIASVVYLCILTFVYYYYNNQIVIFTVMLYGASALINLSMGPRSLILQLAGRSHVQSIITLTVSILGLLLLSYIGTLSIILLIPLTITAIQIAQCIFEYIALQRSEIDNVTIW